MSDTDPAASEEGRTAELEVQQVGDELFALWAFVDMTVASSHGGITERIGRITQRDSEEAAAKAKGWATRLDAVDPRKLRRPTELTRRYLRFEVGKLADAAALHRFDLQITPYRIGITLAELHHHLQSFGFLDSTRLEQYLSLLQQYSVFLADTQQNLRDQAARGIVASAAALPGCFAVVRGLANSFAQYVSVRPERLARIAPAQKTAFFARIDKEIEQIGAAFSELLDYMEGDYARCAEDGVGISQYPGGHEAYGRLVRHHVTLDVTPEALHNSGLDLVAEIEEDMARVRREIGFNGSAREFLEQVKGDQRFFLSTPEAIEDLYMGFLRKCETVMPRAFGSLVFPPCSVKRLPPESEGGMTFGYYQPPTASEPVGYYRYNGSNPDQRPTIGAAALIYHELLPGHHIHLTREMNDIGRPPVRRFPTITAFSEGWAEYAADLGFELGLYEDPYDRYGRHLLQVFLASRLVVDSGLNSLGWTFQKARNYLTEHTAQAAGEIESEILRYASAMPGQALAYAPGRKHFWRVRRAAEKRLAHKFDLPEFHAAVLEGGSLPLQDFTFSIEQWADLRACETERVGR